MQKVTVLCMASEQETSLDALRNLGILHLVPMKSPESADVETTTKNLAQAQSALTVLTSHMTRTEPGKGGDENSIPESAANLVRHVNSLDHHKRSLIDKLHVLQNERAVIEPFGDFNPDMIRSLEQQGISVKLCYTPPRRKISVPEGATMMLLRKDAGGTHFALIRKGEIQTDAKEFTLPTRSLGDLEREISVIETELRQIKEEIEHLSRAQDSVTGYIAELKSVLEYHRARAGMGSDRSIAYIQGFCPSDFAGEIRRTAARYGWGLLVRDPAPDDRVPVLIRNPAWIRPIESLFKLIKILPGYNEVDVSLVFLLFMSLFFAMIVGDAGYGLIFLAATFLVHRKMKKIPSTQSMLMYIFSVCTIIWGVLSGSYFGIVNLHGPLCALRLQWLGSNENVMHLCLLIGAVHLSVAHLWNMVRMINSPQAIAQAGWVCITWTIFFAAKSLLIGTLFPGWLTPVSITALVCVVLFMTPPQKFKAEWVNHALLPLTIMTNFGDVLSYLRLFALGVASLELAGAFNTMAGTIGFGNLFRCLAAALILFAGHVLNILLSLISVLVHGLRLNALEFSTHLGLEWSGVEYVPFAARSSESR